MAIPLYENSASMIRKLVQGNLIVRAISSVVLAPLVLFIIYEGGLMFDIFVISVTLIALHEWIGIVTQHKCESFTSCERLKYRWHISGVMMLIIFSCSLIFIRNYGEYGYHHTLWLILIVWSTDIAAYFFGLIIGGPKIAPKISPKKTWSGCLGGLLFASIVGVIFHYIYISDKSIEYVILSPLISLVSQIGDLFESRFKRIFNIKDSGSIIPGHGGILDRIDGLVFASIFFAIILFIH